MPQFILICRDKPDSVDLRLKTRPSHLDYAAAHSELVLLAGPMLNDDGAPIGSMFLVETESEAAAKNFIDNDPYAKASLFADIEIKPFNVAFGSLVPKP